MTSIFIVLSIYFLKDIHTFSEWYKIPNIDPKYLYCCCLLCLQYLRIWFLCKLKVEVGEVKYMHSWNSINILVTDIVKVIPWDINNSYWDLPQHMRSKTTTRFVFVNKVFPNTIILDTQYNLWLTSNTNFWYLIPKYCKNVALLS